MNKTLVKLIISLSILLLNSCGGGDGGSSSGSFFKSAVQVDSSSFTNSATGDFDGDGDTDLVVTFMGSDPGNDNLQPWLGVPIKIYLQNASGVLEDKTSTMLTTVPSIALARHIEVADFNNDGADDIYFGNHGLEVGPPGDQWYEVDVLLLSNGSGKFNDDAMATNIPLFDGYDYTNSHNFYTHGVDSADIDNDGDIDLVLNMLWGPGITILENDGSGVFSIKNQMTQAELWVKFIKADNNSSPDLFVGDGDVAGNHAILLNDGSGNFNAGTVLMPTPKLDGKIEAAHVADVNGDSRDDLIIGNTNAAFSNHVVQVLINDYDSSGDFLDETTTRLPNPVAMTNNYNPNFIVRDLNGDGDKDMIVVKNNNAGTTEAGFYLNDNFVFTKITTPLSNLSQYLEVADFNNDGLVDIVESRGNGTYVYMADSVLTK